MLCCSAGLPRPFWNRCWYEQVSLCSRPTRHPLMPASGPPDFNYYPGQQALLQLLVKDGGQQPAFTTRPLKEEVLGRLALRGHRHQGRPAPILGVGDQVTNVLIPTCFLGRWATVGRTMTSGSGDLGSDSSCSSSLPSASPSVKWESPGACPPSFCFVFNGL